MLDGGEVMDGSRLPRLGAIPGKPCEDFGLSRESVAEVVSKEKRYVVEVAPNRELSKSLRS